MNRGQIFLKRHSPTILTIIGSTGVIITAVLAVRATPKAMKLIEEAELTKNDKLTPVEVLKTAWMPYIPAAISCLSTIFCIAGANYLNIKKQQSLTSAYILLENSYKEYRNKVRELYGEDTDRTIRNKMIEDDYRCHEGEFEDEVLFFEFNSMRFFECSVHKVLQAECKAIMQLEVYGQLSLNDYYSYLDLEGSPYGEAMGWSKYQMETEQYEQKLEFRYDKVEMSNGIICYNIITNVEPTMDHFCF